jgi:anti-sigma factor RsiW
MTARHPSDDLAAYALGALDRAEAVEVERHLDDCERCRDELHWLAPAVDLLPSSVPQLEPPPRLRRGLMRTVRAEARGERRSWWALRAGWVTLRARPAIAIGAMALLGAGVAGYAVNEASRSPDRTVTAVEATGAGEAILTRSEGEAVLRVERLPSLESGRVYQVWVRDREGLHPYPTFVLDEQGRATTSLGSLPPGAREVLVTNEREGGSEIPTSRPLLSAPLG